MRKLLFSLLMTLMLGFVLTACSYGDDELTPGSVDEEIMMPEVKSCDPPCPPGQTGGGG